MIENNKFPDFYIYKLAMKLSGFTDFNIEFAKLHSVSISNEEYLSFRNSKEYKNISGYFCRNDDSIIAFSPEKNSCFKLVFNKPVEKQSINLLIYLIRSYYKFGRDAISKANNNKLIKEKINDLVLQKGVFAYCLGDTGFTNESFDDLFKCLENWSLKTYEGHNVTYSILVNLNEKNVVDKDYADEYCGTFIDFLGEEYSAILSDGITSIIELDRNCNFISYKSITDGGVIEKCDLNDTHLPIRFSQIVSQFVGGECIGLFLLTNGDFIIAKNKEMLFIRRNGKWLNLSKNLFVNTIKNNVSNLKLDDELLVEIFSTVLDISFSHSGGIISVVDENCKQWNDEVNNEEKPVITKIDLLNENSFEKTGEHIKSLFEIEKDKIESNPKYKNRIDAMISDLKKRLNKKRFLICLLKRNNYFQKIDRKLRAELSGLDGAIVLNSKGKILSCGAIIANTAGSSGGGRGSAARTLSKYCGFSIKISTDGYVEVFQNTVRIYSIK